MKSNLKKHGIIIGGGPAGLASAIELYRAGWRVSIFEKRPLYSKRHILRIDPVTNKLLKNWQINIPRMKNFKLEGGGKIHFVFARHLEECLYNKLRNDGISKIEGEFKHFGVDPQSAVIQVQDQDIHISYDLLIAADGAYSKVKKALNIPCLHFGKALARAIILPVLISKPHVSIASSKINHLHLKKVTLPTYMMILVQTMGPVPPPNLSVDHIIQSIRACGWKLEADMIEYGQAAMTDSVSVELRQASAFANEERAVLLIGDAAASSGFFQGTGVNTALQSVPILGKICLGKQSLGPRDYLEFNHIIKTFTDSFIEDSRFLFL